MLMKLALVLSTTIVSVECVFSTMKYVKSQLYIIRWLISG